MKFYLLFISIFVISCGLNENVNVGESTNKIKIENIDISGYVQKGPFINGTAITISELNEDLSPTGISFQSQIVDNKGSFSVENVSLVSQYVSLRADGFFFNEITGKKSESQITLYAISDISDKSSVNVNLLTHLEKSRVEYLIKEGKQFHEAKAQAFQEILAIFNINDTLDEKPEMLDISHSGKGNGILLAISAMLLGFNDEGTLTELLSNISTDIREDGKLDSQSSKNIIEGNAKLIKVNQIKENLILRYDELGVVADIADFGTYITAFSSQASSGLLFDYPEKGTYGVNILHSNNDTIVNVVSLKAKIPQGSSLKVKLTYLGSATKSTGHLIYSSSRVTGWAPSNYDNEENSQVYTVVNGETNAEMELANLSNGLWRVDYYENSDDITFSRDITIGAVSLKGIFNTGIKGFDEGYIIKSNFLTSKVVVKSITDLQIYNGNSTIKFDETDGIFVDGYLDKALSWNSTLKEGYLYPFTNTELVFSDSEQIASTDDLGVFNFSNIKKVTFYAKGNCTILFALLNYDVSFNSELDNWGYPGINIELSSEWKQYTITLADLKPIEYSKQADDKLTWVDFKEKIYGFGIQVTYDNNRLGNFNVSIDEIEIVE